MQKCGLDVVQMSMEKMIDLKHRYIKLHIKVENFLIFYIESANRMRLFRHSDNIRIAQVLIDNDADVNAVDASGRTPLRLAIDMGKFVQMLHLLVCCKYNIDLIYRKFKSCRTSH